MESKEKKTRHAPAFPSVLQAHCHISFVLSLPLLCCFHFLTISGQRVPAGVGCRSHIPEYFDFRQMRALRACSIRQHPCYSASCKPASPDMTYVGDLGGHLGYCWKATTRCRATECDAAPFANLTRSAEESKCHPSNCAGASPGDPIGGWSSSDVSTRGAGIQIRSTPRQACFRVSARRAHTDASTYANTACQSTQAQRRQAKRQASDAHRQDPNLWIAVKTKP